MVNAEAGSWRTLEHTADLAVEIEAASQESLFATAADALIGILLGEENGAVSAGAPGGRGAAGIESRAIWLEASDVEALFVDWLRELLYLAISDDGEPLFLTSVDWREVGETRLVADITLGDGGISRRVERELKGVTYHDLEVRRRGARWRARVVFDV